MPQHVYGYVLNGFDEIDQWHAESNASVKIDLRRWQTSGSLYFVFTQYRIVSPYHCNTGIEVRHLLNIHSNGHTSLVPEFVFVLLYVLYLSYSIFSN